MLLWLQKPDDILRQTKSQTRVEYETQQLDEALEEMGHTLPANDRDLQERCWRIENVLEDPDGEERLQRDVQDVRQCLGILLRVRYGPDPEIDRFCRGTEGLQDCRIDGLGD